jgi:ATP/maltotriose-dependent transcriptional regulator MalT
MVVDRFEEARGPAQQAIAIARQVGAVAEEGTARAVLGSALVNLGEPDPGLAELAAARRLATQAGDVTLALRATISHSDVLIATGRLEEAAAAALDGLDEARRLGLARFNGPMLASNATEALVVLGDWDQADQVSRKALETAPSEASTTGLPLARTKLELGRGDLDRAETRLRQIRRLLPTPIQQAQEAGPLYASLAEIALWRRDLEHAKQLVAEAVPQVQTNLRYAVPLYALGIRIEADRAETARARHPGQQPPDDGTATALLDRLRKAATSAAAASFPELAAWHATALAEHIRQQGPSDPAAWAAAAAAWQRLGQPYRIAYTLFRQAEALMAGHGDRTTAAEALRGAADITGRLGARPLHAEVQALARRTRLDLTPPTPAPLARPPTPAQQLGLTPREAEVLTLVAAGRSNRQIAQALYISPKTASVHISNLLSKLGVHTRVEAAAIAHRLGLN